ncbi:MAG: hypothetical protein NC177_18395 [Ruminococcus flavefaciens]|nr:hypothetical protein [Ruminococcus flavefaciens]
MAQSKEVKSAEAQNEVSLLSKALSDLAEENKSFQIWFEKAHKQLNELAARNIALYKENMYLKGQVDLITKLMLSNNQRGDNDD